LVVQKVSPVPGTATGVEHRSADSADPPFDA
jgi:hypothetical protein